MFESVLLQTRRGGAAAPAARTKLAGSSAGSMLQFYTGDDSPGKQMYVFLFELATD